MSPSDVPRECDISVPSPARVYDCLLGGKDHYEVDRQVAEGLLEIMPSMRLVAVQNRAFLGRAVRYLAEEAGIRQFLDIGTGLPTQDNVHEVAQRVDPSCRIVYVDHDPIVLAHARALLATAPEGVTAYVDADLRDPEVILERAAGPLDLSRPVALLLVAILHFVPDEDDPHRIVAGLMEALAPGSYLVISHGTLDTQPEKAGEAAREYTSRAPGTQVTPRSVGDVRRFFVGLEPVEPGLGYIVRWRPEGPAPTPEQVGMYGGVARKGTR